jgi:hypothetical protein
LEQRQAKREKGKRQPAVNATAAAQGIRAGVIDNGMQFFDQPFP